tara:strand:- start:1341 stop:2783 length:1443 start_codon:yes stop_codon:yes gene_type:complete
LSNKLDNLFQQQTINVSNSLDSIQYADSLNLAKAEEEDALNLLQLRNNSLDSTRQVTQGIEELQAHKSIKNTIIRGGSLISLDANESQNIEAEILNLTRDVVMHEANNNSLDDYAEFLAMYEDLNNIHSNLNRKGVPYQSTTRQPNRVVSKQMGEWTYQAPVSGNDVILNSDNLRYRDVNGLDKILGEGLGLPDMDLRGVTLARLYASDKDIQNYVYGTTIINDNGQLEHLDGFSDIAKRFNLLEPDPIGTTGFMNFNWLVNENIGSTYLLTRALEGKTSNPKSNYFADLAAGIVPDPILRLKLEAIPAAQREVIINKLDTAVNKIYSKAQTIEKTFGTDFFTKFEKYKERFAKDHKLVDRPVSSYAGMYNPFGSPNLTVDTPGEYYGIDPLEDKKFRKLKELKDKLQSAKDGYKYLTGETYDLNEALNLISLETLNSQLDKLPDYEKTDAFDELLIKLTGELQNSPTGILTNAQGSPPN